MVTLHELWFGFGTGPRRTEVVGGVGFEVPEAGFVSIVGPSGCGKSTLLRLIAGLLRPTAGEILIRGEDPTRVRERQEIAFVFQRPVLFGWRTVLENISLPLELRRNGKPRWSPGQLVELVGLEGFAESFPRMLSGGMQSRVAIARALASDPELLLMDESFGGLDELTRERMNLEVLRIWQKTRKTVVFVTHNLEEAVFLSDRVIVLSRRPATIVGSVDVRLQRPRELRIKSSVEFQAHCRELRGLLEEAGAYEA